MTTYKYLWSDNALTTLATGITTASPSMQVVSGGGAQFPALGTPGTAFIVTLFKNGSPNINEVVLVTGRSGDNLTGLQRNFNGTGALSWNAGDTVAIVPTAEALNYFSQAVDVQTQAGNYAIDIGTANAYIVHPNPPLNASVVGMPIRWKAAHACTGASTFNDGQTTAPLQTPSGEALVANDILATGIYETLWDGTVFRLQIQHKTFSQLISHPTTLSGYGITDGITAAAVASTYETIAAAASTYETISAAASTFETITAAAATYAPLSSFTLTINSNGICFHLPNGGKLQFGTCNPGGATALVMYPVQFTSVVFPLAISVETAGVQTWIAQGSIGLTTMQVSNTGGSAIWMAGGI